MTISNLFETNPNATESTRNLAGTAELTRIAERAANGILMAMEADLDKYTPVIQESATDSNKLFALINDFKPLHEIAEDDMLRHLDEETVDGMLKSQQSKRSRSKGKAMTIDNYRTMLTAAIAEDILREIYNKPKSAGNYTRRAGTVDYTVGQLEAYAEDQEALKREIRNIQSKKSIMKSKPDFDESDERWLALLKAEQQLKDLRVTNTHVVEVDTTKNAIAELLAGKDISKMKSAEAHELLEMISKHVADEAPAEETTEADAE